MHAADGNTGQAQDLATDAASRAVQTSTPPPGLAAGDLRRIERRALARTADGAAEIHEWVIAKTAHGHVNHQMVHYVLKMVR